MKSLLSNVWDFFTNVGWWMCLLFGFLYFCGALLSLDHKQTQYCFDRQMVRVNTPAGHKCVKYEALVNINV